MYDSNIYFKKGRRYYPIPHETLTRLYMDGIPADGVWIIKRDGREANKIGVNPTPMRIDLEQYKERLMQEMVKKADAFVNTSINDMATILLGTLANVLEQDNK